ncbi:magnesium transporter [Hujiaoplasma nucleasis]|uniref:Magnesium transporter MgtE n=1 Tax=Hujiaoplasma nucleasis TaxID=2725268 RepID=A0A7L6N314_9MOLU|nr:magnesium transporter [Hujiaoplasma nucleasis]QLY39627.1 magnesium transporter [Hujiaoplasma nucleasis]
MEAKIVDYKIEILSIIENNIDYPNIIDLLNEYHPYDISRAFIELEDDILLQLIKSVSEEFLADIFEYLNINELKDIIDFFTSQQLAMIFGAMDLDLAVDFIRDLGKKGIEIINHTEVSRRKKMLEMLSYDPDEIGSYLNESFLLIDVTLSIKQAMKYVTEFAHDTDYISIVYIADKDELVGYIKLKDLISARANDSLEEVMETRFPKVYLDDDVEYVAKIMQETRESSIPIIDEDNHLLGVVTHDDLLDIIAEAEEEDYTRFAGLSDYDPDLDTISVIKSVKSRLPWLSILLILSMVTSMILSFFDARLSTSGSGIILAARMAVFLPLILDMAGNTGTQSLAVTIRYLSKNEDTNNDILRRMIFREFKTGIIQGLIIGIIVFGMILFTAYTQNQSLEQMDYLYGLVTSGAIFIALLISTSLGGIIPMLMYRLKIDPAVASGPFITTVSDIITLSIYYTIGMSILLPML